MCTASERAMEHLYNKAMGHLEREWEGNKMADIPHNMWQAIDQLVMAVGQLTVDDLMRGSERLANIQSAYFTLAATGYKTSEKDVGENGAR